MNAHLQNDLSEVAYHALEAARYQSETDRILARHGDAVATFFPDPIELEESGASLTVLHQAMQNGLTAPVLGRLLAAGVEPGVLSDALAGGLEPSALEHLVETYGEDLAGHLANFVEAQQDASSESGQDRIDRVLSRLGE
ncbi:MAG: hypothetical protein K2Y32_11705 [Candidatus Obscuribacterales bacterium]|nr:hypothetical protein [Candidatus Obscuribacterales bacterium]